MELSTLRQNFSQLFPSAASGQFISCAPGRVNLIGEHTDYNDGFVCPMAIDRATTLLAAPRQDALVRMHSLTAHQTVEFPIDRVVPKEGPAWALYPKGAAEAMRQRVPLARGLDAIVDSNVPLGGGLSSSASFEVAAAQAVLHVNRRQLPPEELALACQWAEHNYPGVPSGIMDQFISVLGRKGHALLLDCRSRATTQVPLDDPNLRVVISNSNVKHALVSGEYTARRWQCEAAVSYIRRKNPAIVALRDVTLPMLQASEKDMDPLAFRRARHVVTEIQRTLDFAAALARRDYGACGTLMYASHTSLRDDYEVSTPELDALVDIASHTPGVFGARMTGGGFGGCIVALCHATAVAPLTDAIKAQYPPRAKGKEATTFATVASDGVRVHDLISM